MKHNNNKTNTNNSTASLIQSESKCACQEEKVALMHVCVAFQFRINLWRARRVPDDVWKKHISAVALFPLGNSHCLYSFGEQKSCSTKLQLSHSYNGSIRETFGFCYKAAKCDWVDCLFFFPFLEKNDIYINSLKKNQLKKLLFFCFFLNLRKKNEEKIPLFCWSFFDFDCLLFFDPFLWIGGKKKEIEIQNRNLVDPASVICLSQRLSHACLSISFYTVKLRMAHYISYSLFDSAFTWITVGIRELIHANGSDSVQAWKECIY